ncbi:MAG: ribosomal protein S18-alanine N-acetyltransferase, partial [Candidatus Planktophila sp.]
MTITYRSMIALDIPVIASMEKEIFKDDPWSAGQFKEEVANNGITRHYLVACNSQHQIVGWAGAMCAAEGSDTSIMTIAVDPDYRLRGIARHMLTSLIDWAYSKNSPTIFLEVETKNLAAQALYIAEGFEVISSRKDYYGPGIDALVM